MFDNFINWKYLDLWKVPKNALHNTSEFNKELDSVDIIETPKNECPDCQTISTKMSGGSVIETWNCGNCGRQWMTIKELDND